MPVFLDTRGNASLAIAICSRCSRKFPIGELHPDPNAPGLMCCRADLDVYDPWRLPARQPDKIALRFARPDVPLVNFDPVLFLATEDDFQLVTEEGAFIITENSETPIGFDP